MTKIKKGIFIFSLLVTITLISSTFANTLTPTENEISAFIPPQEQAQLTLLEKLVNINSGTANLAGIYKVGELLRPQFEALGFKTRWVEQPAKMHRAGTLFAERKGKSGKRLLLIAHLDTVFPQDSLFKQFKRNGNNVSGPGVIDDKGGIVVILYALKALHEAHVLDNTSITVVLVGDEEDSGKPTSISRRSLIEAAKRSDVALDFEGSLGRETATIARRGIAHWEIKTTGMQAHSSEMFKNHVGFGAIYELSRILNEIRTQLAAEKYLTVNPAFVLGGTTLTDDKNNGRGTATGKENVIAKVALARGDYRFLTLDQKLAFEKRVTQIVKQHLPGSSAKITFQDGIPAMSPTPQNLALLEKYSEVSQALDQGPVKPLDPGLRGAGDISHIAGIVPANLAGLGVAGGGAHSTDETLYVDSLPTQTQRAALLIYRLTR